MTEEGYIVRGCSGALKVLESDGCWSYIDAKVFELAEEIKEVMWCQSELCRLDLLRREGNVGS